MSTIHGSDSLAWSDEQTRLYLELRIDEKLKGNIRKHTVNEPGRQSIIDKFYEVYGVRHQWKKFGIKFTTCKKQYETFRKLTHNRTGLGYFANGSIDMSEDWWNERCKIPPTQDAEHDADAESWQIPPSNIGNGPSTSTFGNGPSASSRSKASKKRSRSEPAGGEVVAEVIRESLESRDKILSRKNELIESHPELTCNQLRAMEVLHSMPTIRRWSPLYKAAIQHLKEDINNRQTFLCYGDDENKVLYLEYATGLQRFTKLKEYWCRIDHQIMQETFRALIEDDDMDLVLEDEDNMTMEAMRDSITTEMAEGTRLPY
ncbi:unnamed protein product [Arabidopsis thaliana]|uniref:(thale cress) hypothetical protein n=1 Tax=Arabidopsis thaliana TaxID=3702 RepID=A0A7G2E7P5_ARATH|nr:unnamed protein product [Arabidopsis thaliana]